MVEALGRNIKQGDIVLVKKGEYNQNFNIGVVIGKCSVTIDGKSVVKSYGVCYLLENPTDFEKSVGDNLMKNYIKYKAESAKESKEKLSQLGRTPLKNIKAGDIGFLPSKCHYDIRKIWVYLGKVVLDETDCSSEKESKCIRDMYAYTYYKLADSIEAYRDKSRTIDKEELSRLMERQIRIRVVKKPIPFIKDGIIDNIDLKSEYKYIRDCKYGTLYLDTKKMTKNIGG